MNSLAVILVVAAAGFGLARWTRLPVIPLLLLAGISLPLSGLRQEERFLQDAFHLGMAVLVFVAGIELNPDRFKGLFKSVLLVGFGQFLGAAVAGFTVATLIGFDAVEALYLGLALSTSSTLVVVHHLKQQQQMFEPFGRLVIGVLLVQDLLMILVIVGVSRWLNGSLAIAQGLAAAAGLAGLALACQRWVMPFLLMRLKLDDEALLLLLLALLFGFIGLARLVQVPLVAGAFLAGFALARFPVNGVARGVLLSLGDFFRAIFFVAMGSLVVVPDLALLGQAAALALMVLLVTPPLVAAVAEWRGMMSRPAMESGLLLAQTSELALVLGLTGYEMSGQVSPRIFSLIALVTVMTMTLTPFVATDRFTTFLLHLHPLRRRMKAGEPISGHVLVLGFGAGGMWVIKPLLQAGHRLLVVDDDPAVVEQLTRMNIPCLRGDGSDDKVLDRAGAGRARLILASMRRVADTRRVLQHVQGVPVVARVFEADEADQVRRLGGTPILNSLAAADTFTEWFDKTMAAGNDRSTAA
ncbi:MAG: cation:proton antiporter [Verrucomicrobia bacterium]|jgi:CPA2 family monovalent cation:H+ antiporter-2|nr:cation:proton antiporter [Verrucomicrobiota bacterium]